MRYDPRASDNEAQSAALAADVLDEYVRGDSDRKNITRLVMATKHDAKPNSPDEQLLVDIDLSILGANEVRFDDYEKQIREEYSWVTPPAFREGRMKILRQFVDRSSIYSTPFFHERLEMQARQNLIRSLNQLKAGAS